MNPSPTTGCPSSITEENRSESWYHTAVLPDGTSTNGLFDMRGTTRRVPWPAGLKSARCLDIGTCDGFWAFEMERCGAAEVIAIDMGDANDLDLTWEVRRRGAQTPRAPAGTRAGRRFEITRRALGSRVERLACSVYDLDPSIHGRFDVVFCGTLLIHLRDPVRALERMREVCAGELALVECVDAFLDLFGRGVPSARLEPARGQWWRNNTPGLVAALRVAGFDVMSVSRRFLTPFGSGVTARASGWRRPLMAASALLAKWPALSSTPFLVEAVGLACGTYDIAIRARPRLPS